MNNYSDDIEQRLAKGMGCYTNRDLSGWLPIIERLNEQLREIDPDYVIDQIKEKFGALRFYFSAPTWYGKFDDDLHYKKMRWLVDEAEAESLHVCMTCGGKEVDETRRNVGGWIFTLCSECHDVREKRMQEYKNV